MEWVLLTLMVVIAGMLITMQRYAKRIKAPRLTLVEPAKIEPVILPDSYHLHPGLSNETTKVHIVQCESRLSRKLKQLN